jgi:3-oxoacyl-[acyl-carrier protein] reductase
MKLDFTNRNILVLGSSQGIGYGVAEKLALNGANICLVGRDIEKLKQSLAQINQQTPIQNSKNMYVECDLNEKNAAEYIHEQVLKKWSGIDSLVLNAGGPPFVESVPNVTIDEWNSAFQSLFLSQISLVNSCLNYMKQQKFGRIVSISSTSITEPLHGLVISGAIRSALAAWLKSLAIEVGNYGINAVTAIIGKVDTDRIKSLDRTKAATIGCDLAVMQKNNCASIPLGRYGSVDEVANTILFLLSPASSYITGSSITIDGGVSKKYT